MEEHNLSQQQPLVGEHRKSFFQLQRWEAVLLGLSFFLLVFVALPNYFYALEDLRGRECSKRLTLLADSLTYLAEVNNTQPGEKIGEMFDLNELLEQAQGGGSVAIGRQGNLPLYFKIGTEPDCPDPDGDYKVTVTLDENGEIVLPKCTKALGPDGKYYRERGLHVVNTEQVDGDPFNQTPTENPAEN